MPYDYYGGDSYRGGGGGATNYGGDYRGGGGNYSPPGNQGNYAPPGNQGNYSPPGNQGNYSPPGNQGNYNPPGGAGNYGPPGYRNSLGYLARSAAYGGGGVRGPYGAGAGYGRFANYGQGPGAGTATGYGAPPQALQGYNAPAVQSSRQINDPGLLTQGAADPNAAQPSGAAGEQQSGASQQAMINDLARVLGGAMGQADMPQTAGGQSQDTLTSEDVQAAPFKGPWTGTDTGQGLQFGQPYGQGPADNPAAPNTNWAGFDPNAGTEAAPAGGAPPPTATGTGWFSTAGNTAGGEAAPMGGAPAPPSAGWFAPDSTAGGEAAPEGGGPAPSVDMAVPANTGPPSGFLGDTGSGIPGMFAGGGLVPGSTGAPLSPTGPNNVSTAYETSPQGTDFAPGALGAPPGSFQIPDSTAPFAGNNRFAAGDQPDRATTSDLADIAARANQAVPPTDTSANLALQGVDANPPGSLSGGTTPLDPNAFTGMQSQRFPASAGGAPGDITGMGVVPGTTAATITPPAPNSPADFATRFAPAQDNPLDQNFQPPETATPPDLGPTQVTPQIVRPGDPGTSGPAPPPLKFTVTPSSPESTTPPAPPPAQAPATGGSRTGALPFAPTGPNQAPSSPPAAAGGGGGIPPGSAGGGAAPAGAGDTTRGQFDRGQRRSVGQQIFGQGGMVSQLFGGGQLGDTVGSLMAQLGIPAALIFAATRGGGARLPMVSGPAAMSGAGRMGFAARPSANLFPGPGLPALAGLGLGGAALGQRLLNPPAADPNADQPPSGNRGTAGAPGSPTRPTLPTATTGPVATTPADLTGGARPGATRARPAPFGAGQSPQGTMAGANYAPGMLYPITQPGGGTQATNFITQRGGHPAGTGAPPLNPEFASRVQQAAMAYEAETGRRAVFDEMGRSKEQQQIYYDRYRRGQGGLAASPETGRHVKGLAIDIPNGDFQNWMHRNAGRFGLAGLRDPRDPNHFQLADSPVLAGIRQRQASMAQ